MIEFGIVLLIVFVFVSIICGFFKLALFLLDFNIFLFMVFVSLVVAGLLRVLWMLVGSLG